MDKTHIIGILVEMIQDKIKGIEETESIHVYEDVNEAFGNFMEYILRDEKLSQLTVEDLKPILEVVVDFRNRYFKRHES